MKRSRTKPPFEIQHFLLCDFATQDAGGKPIIVGLMDDEVIIPQGFLRLPTLVVHLKIVPLAARFDFSVVTGLSDGQAIQQATFRYEAKVDPDKRERVHLAIQLQDVPLKHDTDLIVRVNCDGHDVARRAVRILMGMAPPMERGIVSLLGIENQTAAVRPPA